MVIVGTGRDLSFFKKEDSTSAFHATPQEGNPECHLAENGTDPKERN
jgi:hypothetical protein